MNLEERVDALEREFGKQHNPVTLEERLKALEKKNIEFSNYIHEGIGNLVLKNQKEIAELKPDSIMHCFCCGTDITDEKNCFCLTCFNDKIAHDIKKDMVISREDFDKLMDLAHDYDFQFYCKLKKEVENK